VAKKATPSSEPVLRFRGTREKTDGTWWLKTNSVKVSVEHEFRPGQARSTDQPVTISVKPDDVIEIEFEEGHRLWINGKEYACRFAKRASRGTAATDDQPVPESLDLLLPGRQSRGPIKWVIKSFKILGIDLEEKTARQIGELIDNRSSDTKKPAGLYRCVLKTGSFSLSPVVSKNLPIENNKPYLLFLHGTASSTWGSFGDLWNSTRTPEREDMYRLYEDRVLAFEHPTFTQSPIDNAIQLVSRLPDGITLHLVSHSRGGLVGELLCRGKGLQLPKAKDKPAASRRGIQAFSAEEFQIFELDDETEQEGEEAAGLKRTCEQLRKLNGLLERKSISVQRFVRVACPALGTTLASRRLDRWVSVVGSVASILPGSPLSDAFSDIADFVAAVIKERTKISELPGLQAMMPESPFIKLVNWPKAKLLGDLTVIAGDIEPDAWWTKLMVFATDRFYEGDHDLVVNTASMYGGVVREGTSLVSFHKGPGVNHFSYFSNGHSAAQIVRALTRREGDATGFQPLVKPTVDIARAVVSRSTEPKPVVFVLPGIMGSELAIGDDKVWVEIPDLMFGGFKKLRLNGAKVTATEPMARYYGDIIEFLGQTHKVVPFPFDWRLPIEQEADRLATTLQQEFQEAKVHGHPVRLLAHSMGGLVARAMMARHNALWREVCAQPGARLVMLGTPNGGSHAITELIVGRSSLMSKLALINLGHSNKELIDIVNRFPGVLSMLPVDPREDYFAPDTWKQYAKYSKGDWSVPRAEDLGKARISRTILDQVRFDPSWAVYIAGCAAATLASMRINPDITDSKNSNDHIEFLGTNRGDGRVTWDSGIPDNIPTWYMDAEHGDLPAYSDAFPAILELLQLGNTSMTQVLSKTPPVSRALDELFPMPEEVEQLYPDRDGLAAAALGGGTRRRQRAPRRDMSVRVRVVHGNLVFVRYPVAVGHYKGDTIISAEKMLDRELDGELSQRLQVGRYPGALGTSAIFRNPRLHTNSRATPKGALVIGLGTAGTLTVSGLIKTMHQALIEHALKQSESPRRDGESEEGLGISALLIGTGAGGLSVSDSVFALLQAVADTNDSLAGAKKLRRITAVDIIELWQDRAIQAVESFPNLQRDSDLQGRFTFDPFLAVATGGRKRASFEEAPGWWHRLQILGGTSDPGGLQGTLRFTATTKRARNEVRLQATQRALVDRFVEQAIRTTQDNRQVSRTLFELLLPNELKEAAPDQDDIVLLLDEDAARYPWELLEDPSAPKEVRKAAEAFSSNDQYPFVIRHGVLRQLELKDFREVLRPSDGMKSLVIGDPKSSFIELPGAQQEATTVARILEGGNFHVESLIRPSSETVINTLYKWPYRILHLAGHGVYRYQPKGGDTCPTCCQILSQDGCKGCGRSPQPVTGMIIGDNMFLTPIEIRQMRQVPEMVFINCCHLGKMSDATSLDESRLNKRQDYNLMAASVATEFIRMGVRAVIATGWAVDDRAASTFARTFYERMLQGVRYGDAVTQARKEAYNSHPGINTWGAYQCYGDPDYRIRRDGQRPSENEELLTFASASAVITEIENLAAQLETIGSRNPSWQLGRLQKIEAWLKAVKWANNGSISLALARAYWEALKYIDALRCYQHALAEDPAAVTLKDIEQLANLTSRACVDLWKKQERGTTIAEQAKRLNQAFKYLDWLKETPSEHLSRIAQEQSQGAKRTASERLILIGSTHKRRAWITDDVNAMRQAVIEMRTYYQQARDAVKDEPTAAYAILNTTMAGLVETWVSKKTAPKLADLTQYIATARLLLAPALRAEPDFWIEVMSVDCDLLEYLAEDKTLLSISATPPPRDKARAKKRSASQSPSKEGTDKSDVINGLVARYQEIRKLGSRKKFASVLDQIEFMETMADRGRKRQIAEELHRLVSALAKEI
jgi:pimeloyl-ACP methyl ester carboxylesterase/tetratricopeptide (TPR) repeat protein